MIDHILWGVPELAAGSRDLAARCGVAPSPGGRHPGVGTHNALVALDAGCYLEIIAPDPSQGVLTGLGTLLQDLRRPKLLTWCARAPDLEDVARRAVGHGLNPSPLTEMQRRRPDGSLLSWRLLFVDGHAFGPLFPFFIDWQDSPHPSGDGQGPCRLTGLTLSHPRAPSLHALLSDLLPTEDRRLQLVAAPGAGMGAQLETPKGRVVLTDRVETSADL